MPRHRVNWKSDRVTGGNPLSSGGPRGKKALEFERLSFSPPPPGEEWIPSPLGEEREKEEGGDRCNAIKLRGLPEACYSQACG